jgi:hypothetical protein
MCFLNKKIDQLFLRIIGDTGGHDISPSRH